MNDFDGHYTRLVNALTKCQIVPFLGPNINLCGRPEKERGKLEDWLHGNFAPSNQELAVLLNQQSNSLYSHEVCCPVWDTEKVESLPAGCPVKQGTITRMPLQHVAQYIVDLRDDGEDILYGVLTNIINATYRPNPLHNFLARLTTIMREKGYYPPYPLVVTTCFDTTLEHAFDNAAVSYDLISFVGQRDGGNFEHKSTVGVSMPIEDPNTQIDFLIERPVILKLYGGYGEQFIVTEDNFIDYLALQNMVQLLPISILDALQNTAYIWFLGYSPSYWNQRIILYRIWKDHIFGKTGQSWWAVQTKPEANDTALWKRYHSIPINVSSLEDYVSEIERRVDKIPPKLKPTPSLKPGPGKPNDGKRDHVFISYSHKDKIWLERLQSKLKPVIRKERVSLWEDTKIKPGTRWKDEIRTAIDNAKAAVLMVSTNYLSSDFIDKDELPLILNAAQEKGLIILWLCLDHCIYKYSDIPDYQALHDVSQPLESVEKIEQEFILTHICERIIEVMGD